MTRFSAILKQADIFLDCQEEQLAAISQLCTSRTYRSGELIFDENSDSDELFIISQGEIEILVNPSLVSDLYEDERQLVKLATLRRGQSFGEIALVDRGLRSAAARTTQDRTEVLLIPRDELLALCESDLHLGYLLMRNLAADLALKMRTADLRMREALL